MTEQDYNGWANRETWNVTLWLQNDEGLYNSLRGSWKARKSHNVFITEQEVKAAFFNRRRMRARYPSDLPQEWPYNCTPDGVSLESPAINWQEVHDCIKEFCED